MEYVNPRTVGQESMTQDNVVKAPVYMPKPENLEGNESGVSTTAGLGTSAGTAAPFAPPVYLNIDASGENRSAQFKNGEGGPPQDVPEAAKGQYQ